MNTLVIYISFDESGMEGDTLAEYLNLLLSEPLPDYPDWIAENVLSVASTHDGLFVVFQVRMMNSPSGVPRDIHVGTMEDRK